MGCDPQLDSTSASGSHITVANLVRNVDLFLVFGSILGEILLLVLLLLAILGVQGDHGRRIGLGLRLKLLRANVEPFPVADVALIDPAGKEGRAYEGRNDDPPADGASEERRELCEDDGHSSSSQSPGRSTKRQMAPTTTSTARTAMAIHPSQIMRRLPRFRWAAFRWSRFPACPSGLAGQCARCGGSLPRSSSLPAHSPAYLLNRSPRESSRLQSRERP